MVRLEHANLVVRDIDGIIRFLQAAFPEFRIRRDQTDVEEDPVSRWVHIGTNETYIALGHATIEPAEAWIPYEGRVGVNHLAYEVDDAEALRERMLAAGYRESTPPNAHPARKRVYFLDPEGNDWEFVEYLTGDPAKRHDYTISDR